MPALSSAATFSRSGPFSQAVSASKAARPSPRTERPNPARLLRVISQVSLRCWNVGPTNGSAAPYPWPNELPVKLVVIVTGSTAMLRASAPLDHQLLDLADRLRRVEALGAGLGAVHDGVAAIEPERVFQIVEPIAGRLVARIHDPAIGLQQHGGAEIAVAVPPVARARGRAAEAQDTLPQAVELGTFLRRLRALARRRGGVRLQPRLDRGVLREDGVEVRDQIFDDRHMRQRVDLHIALHVRNVFGAGEGVGAVDVHRARPAHPFPAGAAEGQGRIDLVLDLDQGVQDHRAARIEIDLVAVDGGVAALVRVPAIDLEGT